MGGEVIDFIRSRSADQPGDGIGIEDVERLADRRHGKVPRHFDHAALPISQLPAKQRAVLAAAADNNDFSVRHPAAYPTTSSFGSGNTNFTDEKASLFSKKLRKCQGSTSR